MSKLRQFLDTYRNIGGLNLARNVYNEMNDDGLFTWAAAMAYSWMFALFPLVIFLLTLVAFLPIDTARATTEVNRMVTTSLPPEAAKLITDQVPAILQNQAGGLLTLGALLTLWAASGGMRMTMSALDRCYDILEDPPFYIAVPKGVLLTLCVLVLVLLVLVLLPVGGLVLAWLKTHAGAESFLGGRLGTPTAWAIDIARYLVALALLFLTVALIYYFGPRVPAGFRFITPGGTFTVAVWLLLGLGFRWYITSFGGAESYAKTYGAVGGAVILLLFMYLTSLVLLLGAEINAEFDLHSPEAVKSPVHAAAAVPSAASSIAPPQPHPKGPVFSPRQGLPPHPPERQVQPAVSVAPAARSRWPLALAASAVALTAGYLLRRPPVLYRPRLTPPRRLPQVYPLTYAFLKSPPT